MKPGSASSDEAAHLPPDLILDLPHNRLGQLRPSRAGSLLPFWNPEADILMAEAGQALLWPRLFVAKKI
jgi:hypothetical protein